MKQTREPKPKKQPMRIPGYGQGIWWLMAASALVLVSLFAVESSRALSGNFRFGSPVEVERIPAEEARSLGVSSRKR